MTSMLKNYSIAVGNAKPTVGDTKFSIANVDHLGWLVCDGRTLNITDYQFLFNTIGNSFGGNGTTTFVLPNPAGRVLGVIGSGSGLTVRTKGITVGEETHTLSIAEMPTHTHTGTTDSGSTGITTNASTNTPVGAGNLGLIRQSQSGQSVTTTSLDSGNAGVEPDISTAPHGLTITDPTHNHSFTTASRGNSNAHNNMQPTLFLGNLFIYSGKPRVGTFQLTVGNAIY